ncbi:helix-turn-helix domain-containing protein [Hufsiella ginkgonis]|uniref:HTH cro/C1-type domain-containing protein n=1 Tax=Hufsiella ginkgonis TaxID=2695274 RepID=A0A7K1XUA9_9SPHI|nr:helix-turn-helix transcriptional regulator [Hufsiella ginkgonis]MXV14574.1 hypothetical protein [Hufsiella ginkgonis]
MQIHVGERIYQVFKEKGWTIDFFAKRVHMTKRNAQYLFKRDDISIDQLTKISKAMDYDFVQLFLLDDKQKSLAEDPSSVYTRPRKELMTVSLSLTFDQDQSGKLPEMLKRVRMAAEQLGFQLN